MKLSLSVIAVLFLVFIVGAQTTNTLNHANQLVKEQKYKQAITVLDKVIETNPTAQAFEVKTECQLQLKEYENAFATITAGIRMMPDSTDLFMMRGQMLEQFKMSNEAIDDFTIGYKRCKTNQQAASFLANRGRNKNMIMDYQGAYDDLTKAMTLDTTELLILLINLAPVCNHLGKNDEAIKYLTRAVSIDSTDARIYVNIGYNYQQIDKHELAIQAFNKVVQLNPDEPLAYSNRSYSKYKLNDLKGAREDINKSIKMFPTNSYAYKIRALIEFAENKNKAGCEDVTKSLELGYAKQYGDEVTLLQKKYCK
jgi:tetratricopeptide (TPR) repeat protein